MQDVGLSDLFWYFLCPGPDIHQEHIEANTPLYTMVSDLTKVLLNVPTARLEVRARVCMFVRMYVCVHVCMCACMFIRVNVCMCACTNVCMYVCVCLFCADAAGTAP